jgi:signal transduction histidine kinase/HAMP domain-containing protein
MDSIAKQVLVALLLAVLGITGAWGGFELYHADEAGHEQFIQDQHALTERLAHNLTYPVWNLNRAEVEKTLQYEAVHPGVQALLVYGDDGALYAGKLLAASGGLKDLDPQDPGALAPLAGVQPFESRAIVKNGASIGRVVLYVTEARLQGALRRQWVALFLQLLALVAALFGVLYVALRRVVIQPLAELKQWVLGLQPGESPATLRLRPSEEINALADSFATMARRLNHSVSALSASEEWHRVLFERSRYALMTLSPPTWSFESGNPAAIAMFRASDEAQFRRLGLWQLSPELQGDGRRSDEAARERIDDAMRDGSTFFEWTHRRLTGEDFPASVLLTRVEISGRAFLQATVRDETEKKRLESTLAQRDRLASMGMLAAGVAHEINNPLAYVMMHLEGLSQGLEPGGAAESARKALEGIQRIREITRGLNAFARIDSGGLEAVDLNRAVEQAANMAQHEVKLKGTLHLDLGALPRVLASEGKLAQVLLNLLVNAAHSIEDGAVSQNRVSVRTWAEGSLVFAEVADTGRGIVPENLERIWEPFFTTKASGQGTGLGLAICRSIVEGFGGTISVQSLPGRGSRFLLRLPAQLGAEARAGAPAPALPPALPSRGRILIIDDEDELRDAMRKVLELQHEVVTAGSGLEGREALTRDPRFDVILCDLMMPDYSGMDLHAWLLERHPALARNMVFVSGGAFTPRASAYLADLANTQIEKPFPLATLQKVVSETILASRTS